MISRRKLLERTAQFAVASQSLRFGSVFGGVGPRLVLFVLRGALDGLAAVPPYGEPRYRSLRQELAISSPGPAGAALRLDGLFALHPALKQLHSLFADGQVAIVHAVATPYRQRSHFDGQRVLENGGSKAGLPRTGWLNRALLHVSMRRGLGALAVSQNVPRILQGNAPVTTWAPSRLPDAADALVARVVELYSNDSAFSMRLEEALRAERIAAELAAAVREDGAADRSRYRTARLAGLATAAGRFLASDDGPRIAVLESSGWDTHANQGAEQGVLAARLRDLDAATGALQLELGSCWEQTVVMAVTEFGRTVAVNGTRGTDHGTASCAILAGGAVNGGRIVADWPGLSTAALTDERDLRPTTDLRSVFKAVLRDHLGISQATLDHDIFPGTPGVPALEGLIAV